MVLSTNQQERTKQVTILMDRTDVGKDGQNTPYVRENAAYGLGNPPVRNGLTTKQSFSRKAPIHEGKMDEQQRTSEAMSESIHAYNNGRGHRYARRRVNGMNSNQDLSHLQQGYIHRQVEVTPENWRLWTRNVN
jgi:hypothetical protein